MNNLGIQNRVFLVSLVPLVVTGVLLSGYFIFDKIIDIGASLDEKGRSLAEHLAPAAEYGVISGNLDSVTRLLYSAARDPDIQAIVVTDARDGLLVQTRPSSVADIHALIGSGGDGLSRAFQAPIFRSSLAVDDFESAPGVDGVAAPRAQPEQVGNVYVVVTREHAIARQTDAIVNGLWITFVAFLVTAYLAARLAQGVTSPIRSLTRVVGAIREGDLGRRLEVDAGGEIGLLQEGVNAMAESLQRARENERRRAEDEIFIEKVKAQTTLESLGEGVLTTGADGRVTYLNPAAECLTGWSSRDAVGRPLGEVFHIFPSAGSVALDYPVQECIDDGRTIHHDLPLRLLSRNGAEFIIQDTATPIRDKQGRVIGMVLVFHDYSNLHRMSERLAYQASHDDLTGLLNRREFEVQLSRTLEEVRRDGTEHALCYIDLDQFKVVNDTCGHHAGDELLRQLTLQIESRIRKHDVFARLGGDEFGIILKDCPMDSAAKLAEDIRNGVRSFQFAWQQHSFEVGASIGLVPISNAHVTSSELMMTADSACYIAKDKGRNRIHIYEPTDEDVIRHTGDMQWLQRLNQSLEADSFELHGQCIVPLAEGASHIDYHEVLLRMRDPERGLILPDNFIPAAERYQLMMPIDQWVVSRVFRMLGESGLGRASGGRGVPVFSINLSAQSLTEEGFLDFVTRHLDASGIDPAMIAFEITETAAITHLARAVHFIEALKARGCRFLLDDFGSGLSSFGYLSNLPIDYIKIDGHFVSDLTRNPVSRSIVESIVRIGRVMGVKTIAEFVESAELEDEARQCGIDYAQGYGIREPRPLADVIADLRAGRESRSVG